MTNNKPVPTMSTDGWVFDASTKLDRLLSHFYLSDYNQTQLYPGHVASITRIIQTTGAEVNSVIIEINKVLNSYLSSYFDNVLVEVKPETNLNEDPRVRINLIIDIRIIEKDNTIEYSRLLKTTDSKMSEIIKLNN